MLGILDFTVLEHWAPFLRAHPCFHCFSTFGKDLLGKNSGKSALKKVQLPSLKNICLKRAKNDVQCSSAKL